jgi:hypoxanthine-guanine phosphoribosyltransferase
VFCGLHFALFRASLPADADSAPVLLRKKMVRTEELDAVSVGFRVGDELVVGYDLDCLESDFNLPSNGVLKPRSNAAVKVYT